MKPSTDTNPTEVRTYQLRNGSLDVPNLLRVLANELETADRDCIDNGTPGTYLSGMWEQDRCGGNFSMVVVLEHDHGWDAA